MKAILLPVGLVCFLAAPPARAADTAAEVVVPVHVMTFRRGNLSEVCEAIQAHTRWQYAYPASLGRCGTVTLTEGRIAIDPHEPLSRGARIPGLDTLARIARALGGSVEVKTVGLRQVAVFWQRADDAHVVQLTNQLRDQDEARACAAAAALGRLADRRAFSALIEALGDTRPRLRAWVFNALEDQIPPPTPGRLSVLRWCLPAGAEERIANGLAAARTPSERERWIRLVKAAAVAEAVPSLEQILTTSPSSGARWLAADALVALPQKRSVDALLKAITEDRDPGVRRRAADALGGLRDDIPVSALAKVIQSHRSPEVQTAAVRVLVHSSTSWGQKEMIRTLQYHPRMAVRAAAAGAYASAPRWMAILFLRTAVTKGETPAIRAGAAESLGCSPVDSDDPDGVVPALLTALKEDKSWLVRGGAAEALGRLGRPAAGQALLEAMTRDTSAFVRCRAAEALAELNEPNALAPLVELLQGPDEAPRACAGRALVGYALAWDKQAVAKIAPALDRKKPPAVRRAAAWALGQTFSGRDRLSPVGRRGALSAVPHLARAMKDDPDTAVRLTAARGLGRIADARAIDALGEALARHPDVEVREAAAVALGRSESSDAVKPLLTVFADQNTDENLRVVVADALAELRDESCIDPLVKILKGPLHPGRRLTASILGRLRNPRVIEPLTWWMQNGEKGNDRASGAAALGTLGDPSAIDPLVTAMNTDRHYRVWYAAAEALARIDDPRILRPLWRVMIRNDETPVRQSAARGLGTVRDPVTVERMIGFLTRGSRDLRDLGAQVLGRLRDRQALEPLLAVLKGDSDPQVRESAAAALRTIDPDRPAVKAALDTYVAQTSGDQ